MILKGADALPHGLINEVDGKLGRDGELLAEYVSWLVGRIRKLGRDGLQRIPQSVERRWIHEGKLFRSQWHELHRNRTCKRQHVLLRSEGS